MPIACACPQCQKSIKAPDHLAGKRGKCPACGTAVEIPPAAPFDPLDVLELDAPVARPVQLRRSPPPSYSGSEATTSRASASTGPYQCASCNSRSAGRRYVPGSILIEILIWCLPIAWPFAAYYSWYRRRSSNRECPICKGRDLVRV